MDNGRRPDQLSSKARLMTVVNLASEEWSCPCWTTLLCDRVVCVCACVCLSVFVNVSQGLNDGKQMPAVGASTYNPASLPPEITTPRYHLAGPHLVTPSGCWREGKWISMIPSLFNKLIKHCAMHPEAILKWLSHSSVMLLIDGGRKGAQEGGTMEEGTRERCGGDG